MGLAADLQAAGATAVKLGSYTSSPGRHAFSDHTPLPLTATRIYLARPICFSVRRNCSTVMAMAYTASHP